MFEEIITPLFATEWSRRAGIGVVIGMSCLLLYTFITMFFTWHADYHISRSASAVSVSHSSGSDNVAKWIAQIPDWHLFGKYGAVSQAAGLPVTSLQLRLIGVIKADPEQYSRVIIAEGDGPGKVYQVGDTLSSGVRVYAITDNGVVLENGGEFEKLPLQRARLEFQGKPKSLLNAESPEE